MLAIRMQRTGRSGHAQFRLIVQDSRFSPKSGRVTAFLGSYDPHTKVTKLDKETAVSYLTNGAVPSDRMIKLLKKEGVKLPTWVKEAPEGKKAIRNPEKRRSTRPENSAKSAPAMPTKEDSPVQEVPAENLEALGQEQAVSEEKSAVAQETASEPDIKNDETLPAEPTAKMTEPPDAKLPKTTPSEKIPTEAAASTAIEKKP